MDVILTAKQLIEKLKAYDKTILHIHHTWKPSHKDFNKSNHFDLVQSMRQYHMVERGWSDIGQHVTLFPDGLFVTGRDFIRNPASASGYNTQHVFMVEMVGNFDIGNDVLDGDQLNAICELINWFPTYVLHREMDNRKTCPGTGVTREVLEKGVEPIEFKMLFDRFTHEPL